MSQERVRAAEVLEALKPRLLQEFMRNGPLHFVLPDDIRQLVLETFTDVLGSAVVEEDEDELANFIEEVVWEARKLGVEPAVFLQWLDRYEHEVAGAMPADAWSVTRPLFVLVREHILRIKN